MNGKVKKSRNKSEAKRLFSEGRKAELAARAMIARRCKLSTKHTGDNRGSPFDVLVDGRVRVECKDSRRGHRGMWHFSIKRHGKLNESAVDAYVFSLRDFAKRYRVYVVMPAPLGKASVAISLRSLVTKYAKYIDAWELISELSKRRTEIKREVA